MDATNGQKPHGERVVSFSARFSEKAESPLGCLNLEDPFARREITNTLVGYVIDGIRGVPCY